MELTKLLPLIMGATIVIGLGIGYAVIKFMAYIKIIACVA